MSLPQEGEGSGDFLIWINLEKKAGYKKVIWPFYTIIHQKMLSNLKHTHEIVKMIELLPPKFYHKSKELYFSYIIVVSDYGGVVYTASIKIYSLLKVLGCTSKNLNCVILMDLYTFSVIFVFTL